MRRLLTVAATVAALAVPASIATAGFTQVGTAGAASGIQCSSLKLSGTLASGTITVGKCTPSGGKGYKTATGSAAALVEPNSNLTWSKSGATTTVTITATAEGQGLCKKKYTQFDASGTVTGASTTGVGVPAVGDAISAEVCIDATTNKLKLVTGTTFSL